MTTSNVDIQNLVTVQQAAQLLNITPAAIHKAIKRGRLPYLKLGRVFVIQRTDLIQYRKTKSVGGRPKKARPWNWLIEIDSFAKCGHAFLFQGD